MFIIFGWAKETKAVGPAVTCYCYRCQRTRSWEHWKETEWVSLFLVRLLPFTSRNHVVCSGCREPILLDRERSRLLGGKTACLAEFIEEHQLAQKSAVQRTYLRAQREQNASRE